MILGLYRFPFSLFLLRREIIANVDEYLTHYINRVEDDSGTLEFSFNNENTFTALASVGITWFINTVNRLMSLYYEARIYGDLFYHEHLARVTTATGTMENGQAVEDTFTVLYNERYTPTALDNTEVASFDGGLERIHYYVHRVLSELEETSIAWVEQTEADELFGRHQTRILADGGTISNANFFGIDEILNLLLPVDISWDFNYDVANQLQHDYFERVVAAGGTSDVETRYELTLILRELYDLSISWFTELTASRSLFSRFNTRMLTDSGTPEIAGYYKVDTVLNALETTIIA